MKKIGILFILIAMCLSACKTAEQPTDNGTLPEATEPRQTENVTADPYEYESEIDFSDFGTVSDETQPAESDPEETEPATEEPTQTVPPVLEPDGYNSQIIRP